MADSLDTAHGFRPTRGQYVAFNALTQNIGILSQLTFGDQWADQLLRCPSSRCSNLSSSLFMSSTEGQTSPFLGW